MTPEKLKELTKNAVFSVFPVKQKLMIPSEKMLVSAELKGCVT